MAKARTRAGLKTNALGTARPFIAGLENPRITALDALAWQAFTEVSGLNIEKTESTTITLPSDNDGFNYDEVTISYGGFQDQTFTLTEYMDERSNAPYLDAMLTDAPGSLWLPEGRNRRLSDPYDFQSGILIDHFTISADTKDDNANPSDGDPGNPNKVSATGNFHGRNRHVVKPMTLTESTLTASGASVTGVSFQDVRETNAGIGREFFAVETGAASAEPKIHKRDAYGTWTSEDIGSTDNVQVFGLENAGTHLITVNRNTSASENSQHFAIQIDDLSSATAVSHPSDLVPADEILLPLSVWAKSPTEIWFTYGGIGTDSHHALGKSASPTESPVAKLTNSTDNTRLYAIHGLNDQLVAVGGTGNTGSSGADSDYTPEEDGAQTELMYTSKDNGETWSEITGPSGAKALTSVFMTDTNTFFIGSIDGKVWFTHDFGTTWTTCSVDAGINRIAKISFYWPEGADRASRLGYVLAKRSSGNNLQFVSFYRWR